MVRGEHGHPINGSRRGVLGLSGYKGRIHHGFESPGCGGLTLDWDWPFGCLCVDLSAVGRA